MDSASGRKVLTKFDEESNPDYGCKPVERSLEDHLRLGVLVLDKPAGPTSHQAADWVKKIVGASKAGHSGTLDPQVTGVLLVGMNDSTKILNTLLAAPKEYVGVMRLHAEKSEGHVRGVFSELTGKIFQRPPVKSAVKRQLRVREIYELELLELEGRNALFRCLCEAGTYIRKLCHDAGLILGCGGHMLRLRRTRVGPLGEEHAVKFHDLKDAWELKDEAALRKLIHPVEDAVAHLPRAWLRDTSVDGVCHGSPAYAPGVAKLEAGIKEGDAVALYSLKEELVAVAEARATAEKIFSAKKGEAFKPARVVMTPGTYPRHWKTHADRAEA